ncbi:hypothetical protein Bca52824_031865 [Brassica carinata]|uniref:Uncharacterized protein n=1 Tax=Brassica carinata TaxID=52824 RepID=A0A8X7S9Y8_BRACI|nr:hypothetical protein Bca52824_031865 [Brassica carinata]
MGRMGFFDSPPEFTAESSSGSWSFAYIGLLGVFIVGGLIYFCWKRRQQTTQQVTPVGEVEMSGAAP